MQKYVMEFIGTFFLVLVVGLSVVGIGAGAMAPLAIGSILMVMVFAGGHISGAHYNPAVTLAVWMRKKHDLQDVWGYMGAQFLAAIIAALIVGHLKKGSVVITMEPRVFDAFLVELLFTFALAFVVLNVATAKGNAGNSFFGLAIGFTLMAGAYAAGNISGGAFNPAVALGIILLGLAKGKMFLVSFGQFWRRRPGGYGV